MIRMKLDEGGCVFGAGILLRHLRALEQEFMGVREGHADIEYIHRMRVASRRLRATLPLFSGCLPGKKAAAWLKEIRKVTRALGEARDTDVQIDHLLEYTRKQEDAAIRAGLNRLVLRLRQKREALQAPLARTLDELRSKETLEEMHAFLEPVAARAEGVYLYTPALYAHAFEAILGRLDVFEAYDEIVPQVDKVEELHQMRIAAKWLRYTMETFAPLYKGELKEWLQAVKSAQEDLGEIHDCDVWSVFIPRYLEEEHERVVAYFGHARPYARLVPGVTAYAAARKAERDERYERFAASWEKWKNAELWDGLRLAVQTPGLFAPNA